MSNDELRVYLKYAALALGAFLAGSLTALVPQLMDPTMPDLNFRIVVGSGLSALIAAFGGAFLPRQGSVGLSKDVDALRSVGIPRTEMTVVKREKLSELERRAAELEREFPDALRREQRP